MTRAARVSGVDNRSRKGPQAAGRCRRGHAQVPCSRAGWDCGSGAQLSSHPPQPSRVLPPRGASPGAHPQPWALPPAVSRGRPEPPSAIPTCRPAVLRPRAGAGGGGAQPGPPSAARHPSPRPCARRRPAGQLGVHTGSLRPPPLNDLPVLHPAGAREARGQTGRTVRWAGCLEPSWTQPSVQPSTPARTPQWTSFSSSGPLGDTAPPQAAWAHPGWGVLPPTSPATARASRHHSGRGV